MEGQSCTQHRSYHHIVLWQGNINCSQRCGDSLGFVLQSLRQFIRHHLAYTLDVMTEQQSVLLIVLVSQLSHILVEYRIGFAKIYYFNHTICF